MSGVENVDEEILAVVGSRNFSIQGAEGNAVALDPTLGRVEEDFFRSEKVAPINPQGDLLEAGGLAIVDAVDVQIAQPSLTNAGRYIHLNAIFIPQIS